MDYPKTLEEAQAYRYNKWGGNPDGDDYDINYCAYEVLDKISRHFHQCWREPQKDYDLFCWQHAKQVTQSPDR